MKPEKHNIVSELISASSSLNMKPQTIKSDFYISEIEPDVAHSQEHIKAAIDVVGDARKLVNDLQKEVRRTSMVHGWTYEKTETFEKMFTKILEKL